MEQLEFILRLITIVISSISPLIGVLIGWFLAKRSEEKMLKASEIRNELEKAYGPLYSIVSRPEEMVKIDEGHERRVVISEEEKRELDRILMSCPHMFPYEIVVLWRTEIRELAPCGEIVVAGPEPLITQFQFGIPLKFKEEITKEYEQRLQEYYKTIGRWKSVKDLPKWTRA